MEARIELKGLECTECAQFHDGEIEIEFDTKEFYLDEEIHIPFDCHKCGHKQYVRLRVEVDFD